MTQRSRGFEILPFYIGSPAKIPQRGTNLSAGYDLSAAIEQPWRLAPGRRVLVPTGLTAYMPNCEEMQIRSRSGLAFNHGIIVLNSPGTVDADYYGKHIQVLLFNSDPEEAFTINPGDRIAQAVFSKYYITDDDAPVQSIRTGGFGHTGV